MDKKPYYISTAIAYTSAKPHIGNTYEIVLADAIARYKRMDRLRRVISRPAPTSTARRSRRRPRQPASRPQQPTLTRLPARSRRIWDLMNTTYDKFIRTTDPDAREKGAEDLQKAV